MSIRIDYAPMNNAPTTAGSAIVRMSEYIVQVEGQMPDAIYERELTEIVRCRDCANLNIVGKCPCGFWALENLDGFCAWAEKRTDE